MEIVCVRPSTTFWLLLVASANVSLQCVMDTMDILLWIVLPAFLLGGGAVFYFNMKPKADESPLYLRCPGCTRKIRYFKRQVGHRGMCSHCKAHWNFPEPTSRHDHG
jgi:hypothetical protein